MISISKPKLHLYKPAVIVACFVLLFSFIASFTTMLTDVFVMAPVLANAGPQAPVELTLSAGNLSPQIGQVINVDIVAATHGHQVQGLDVHLKYDPSILELVPNTSTSAISAGNLFPNAFTVKNIYNDVSGTTWYALVNMGKLEADPSRVASVGTYQFKVVGSGTCKLSFGPQVPVVASGDGVKLPADYNTLTLNTSGGTASSVDLRLATDDTTLQVGDVFEVDVTATTNGNLIQGFDFQLAYDTDVLEVVPVSGTRPFVGGNIFSNPSVVRNTYDATAGTAWYAVFNIGSLPSNPPKTVKLGTLKFEAVSSGTSNLSFAPKDPKLASENGDSIPFKPNSLKITVN